MPELPDVTVYVEALRERILGHQLIRALVRSPFLLRTADPPLSATQGRTVNDVRRLGKQIAVGVDGALWLVLHLKIAGRLHWNTTAPKMGGRKVLAAFEFDNGWLWLTEAGTQHRAGLHVVAGEDGLQSLSAGGIEPLDADLAAFSAALRAVQPYAQARAHRPAYPKRHRERLFRRDPASRPALADRHDAQVNARGNRAPVRAPRARPCWSGSSACAPRRPAHFRKR